MILLCVPSLPLGCDLRSICPAGKLMTLNNLCLFGVQAGREDPSDLIADLDQALGLIRRASTPISQELGLCEHPLFFLTDTHRMEQPQ